MTAPPIKAFGSATDADFPEEDDGDPGARLLLVEDFAFPPVRNDVSFVSPIESPPELAMEDEDDLVPPFVDDLLRGVKGVSVV